MAGAWFWAKLDRDCSKKLDRDCSKATDDCATSSASAPYRSSAVQGSLLTKKKTWRDLGVERAGALRSAMYLPGIELAERVGHFAPPFDSLQTELAGFSEHRRFQLDRVLRGDPDAIAVRDFVSAGQRYWRLDELVPPNPYLEIEYMVAHEEEFQAFRREHYPWIFSDGPLRFEPDPRADELLDQRVCDGLRAYGFTRETRKITRNSWKCHSAFLPRKVTIVFDKTAPIRGTKLAGELHIDDLRYRTPLGDPFFFSGGGFYASRADDLPAQLDRFFSAYYVLFDAVADTLSRAIAAADAILTA